MVQRILSTQSMLALLIAAMTALVNAGAPGMAHGAAEAAPIENKTGETPQYVNSEKNRKKIRKENDEESKAREPLYPQQARSLARHYKATAAIIARQGGDAQPLLDAAAYFERQSQ